MDTNRGNKKLDGDNQFILRVDLQYLVSEATDSIHPLGAIVHLKKSIGLDNRRIENVVSFPLGGGIEE